MALKFKVAEVMEWGPCGGYSRARIQELVGNGAPPEQIRSNDSIPMVDRFWALSHLLSSSQRRRLFALMVELFLPLSGERLSEAVVLVRLFALGELTRTEFEESFSSLASSSFRLDDEVSKFIDAWVRHETFTGRTKTQVLSAVWLARKISMMRGSESFMDDVLDEAIRLLEEEG